jgi:hypothetical protein
MSSPQQAFNLRPVGYLITQDASGKLSPTGSAGTYYGVDRLPPFIAADPAIREALGEPPIDNPELFQAFEDYFTMVKDVPTPFLPRYEEAMSLLLSLGASGIALELVFCELAFGSSEQERTAAYPNVVGDRPNVGITYGFDVSWPACTHSAIRQPGVVPKNENWLRRLNRWGLLCDCEDALRLRSDYLVTYPYPPFDIFLVHSISRSPHENKDNQDACEPDRI